MLVGCWRVIRGVGVGGDAHGPSDVRFGVGVGLSRLGWRGVAVGWGWVAVGVGVGVGVGVVRWGLRWNGRWALAWLWVGVGVTLAKALASQQRSVGVGGEGFESGQVA